MSSPLRAGSAHPPTALALAASGAWFLSADVRDAGISPAQWAPAGVAVLTLVALQLRAGAGTRARIRDSPALPFLAAFVLWGFVSCAWAADPEAAFAGANRTLLYSLLFLLFAVLPLDRRARELALVVWTLGSAGLATVVLLRLELASDSGLVRLVPSLGRLEFPTGYANATAAQWMLPLPTALLMLRNAALAPTLRAALATSVVLLSDTALFSQSRGATLAVLVVLGLLAVTMRWDRAELAIAASLAIAIGLSVGKILSVGNDTVAGRIVPARLHEAILLILAGSVIAFVSTYLFAQITRRRSGPLRAGLAMRRTSTIFALLSAAAVLAMALPISRGYLTSIVDPASGSGSGRLTGLGSARSDFARVALDETVRHPILGIGVDNFGCAYLLHRRTQERPRYPHSVELSVLVGTGAIGAVLFVGFLSAAAARIVRSVRHCRERDRVPYALAAAVASFGYWLIHASGDWLWEIPGVTAPAFALLGLAYGIGARGSPAHDPLPAANPPASHRGSAATLSRFAVAVLAVLAWAALSTLWLSELV